MSLSPTERILEKLISFATVSRDSNHELIDYVQGYLESLGIESQLIFNDEKTKANLHARFGPEDVPGVMLSGHTDVVPVDGQDWNFNPFSMVEQNGNLYGRGTTDMKGFIASVLALLPAARDRRLSHPIHLALSYDEEIGCVGVRRMIDMLETAPRRPAFCIVGEPTEMQVAIAHKGKTAAVCHCRGVEAHSALTDRGLNAIYLATEMIQGIRGMQETLKLDGEHDHHYNVPYTTLHVGTIEGGTALNIIPKECSFKFEVRNLHRDDPNEILSRIQNMAEQIVSEYREDFPDAEIRVEVFNQYPALDTSPEEDVVKLVQGFIDSDDFIKLAFGTEGGLFQGQLGIPTVVCGPGSMDQGHKPDEFVAREQLKQCDQFLMKLLDHISIP
ncbi:MAG: acetylornithine deacetylase [bacterium]